MPERELSPIWIPGQTGGEGATQGHTDNGAVTGTWNVCWTKTDSDAYVRKATFNIATPLQEIKDAIPSLSGALSLPREESSAMIERKESWLESMVAKEASALRGFFGRDIDMSFYRQTLEGLGIEHIRFWASFGLGIHFLPRMTLTRETQLPGWLVKPDDFYWGQLEAGNFYNLVGKDMVQVKATTIPGQVLLIDHRLKPYYDNGKQQWDDDKEFLGAIMAKLRKEQAIEGYQYGPQTSRFGVSANEVQQHVRPAVADLLGLSPDQVGLEPTLVANLIPQIHKDIPRTKDGTTDTWVWNEEYFKSADSRVCGGDSYSGGLADVSWGGAADGDDSIGFRLQGVLATQTLGT